MVIEIWLVVDLRFVWIEVVKYLVFNDFFVIRWFKWSIRRWIFVWDIDDEGVGCILEYCVFGWMLYIVGL